MSFAWPSDFERIPDDEWTRQPLGELALKYDTVESHGWYRNLEPTLDEMEAALGEGDLVIDYSGGTGILTGRFFRRAPRRNTGFVIVDASPKFLRLALDKFRSDDRVAFRWIRYLREEKRLETLDEVLSRGLLDRRADALTSTNAIHLYYDLPETLASWARVLRPGAPAFVQSGNIDNPDAPPGSWIIDNTVASIDEIARRRVREDDRWARFRPVLDDAAKLRAYERLREKYFIPVRPLAHYLDALTGAGFRIAAVRHEAIEAGVADWFDFLSAYHEGVLGWVGGVEKIDGRPPSGAAVADRLALIRESLDALFDGSDSFRACWTYITAKCESPRSRS